MSRASNLRWGAVLVLGVALLAPAAATAQSDARNSFLTGNLGAAAESEGLDSWSLQALVELARADEALAKLGNEPRRDLLFARARAHHALGELDAADRDLRLVVDAGGADALPAVALRAEISTERGRLDEAESLYDSLIRAYNARSDLSADDLIAVGKACRWLGREDPQLFKDALRAFDEATAASPAQVEPAILIGELFLEKYDSTQARESLAPLARSDHPRALLAMARVHHFEGSPEAMTLVDQALEKAPKHVASKVFKASLLLEQEDADGAQELLEQALEARPGDLQAQSYLAAAHFLRERREDFAATEQAVLAANPRYADFYTVLAEVSVQNRLYPEARDFAERGIELDERSWKAHGILGQNLLRLGAMDSGRKSLETAFAGDPYNVWIKNTLDLLDKDVDNIVTETRRFIFSIHKDESALLAPILGELAERAYDHLAKRYRYEPPTPIRIEIYRDHADFSVRTVGLTGLGALGVSFGPVIAVDSPAARVTGSFNFGTTFWHELAHTFTLGVTRGKIPRWLTEGLSVFEEHRSGQVGWGDDPGREFLQMLHEDKLLSLIELNEGFVRPQFPNQIGLSYYQASLICELLEERYGWESVLALLDGYRDGLDTAQGVQKVLEKSLEDFNEEYFTWLRERFATPLAALEGPDRQTRAQLAEGADDTPENYRMQLAKASVLLEEEKPEEAIPYLERAKELFPAWVGSGNPYVTLAQIYADLERPKKEIAELRPFTERNEYSYREHRRLAELLSETGAGGEESAVLDRARYIYPYEVDLHQRLAELAEGDEGERADRQLIQARRAILALGPPNRAAAHLDLAKALLRSGDARAARREVLRSLELAPSFPEAQDMLLELTGGGS